MTATFCTAEMSRIGRSHHAKSEAEIAQADTLCDSMLGYASMARKKHRKTARNRKGGIAGFVHDNGLTLLFVLLFLICLVGQLLTGLQQYNDAQKLHHMPVAGYGTYIGTGDFLDGIFANWQAALLQLGCLILFGAFLYQRGATHSKNPDAPKSGKRHPTWRSWLYSHSLSLTFFVLFLITLVIHLLSSAGAYNADRAVFHQPPVSLAAFAVSTRFWFLTFQTWEAEFFAIAAYVLLSISLREDGSPESKPNSAADGETGHANE